MGKKNITTAPPPGNSGNGQITGSYLTRAVTIEQINANRGHGPTRRRGEVREIDVDRRTVSLAFASGAPVERWFGEEVLQVTPQAMRTERISDGAALLLNHDWDRQIGVVETVVIGNDQVARAQVRFSSSPEGEAVFKDVVDGIRRHVSVGYRVNSIETEYREGQADLVTVTDWEPYEISIVSVPADTTVGIGRAAPEANAAINPENASSEVNAPEEKVARRSPMSKLVRQPDGSLVRAVVDEQGVIVEVLEILEQAGEREASLSRAGTDQERARVTALLEMGRTYGAVDEASEAIRDGHTPDRFQARLLEQMHERGNRQRPLSEGSSDIGMSDADIRNYSIFRGLRAMLPNATQSDREAAAFERECSEAAQRQYGREARGLLIPNEVLARSFNAGGAATTPAGAATGANMVGTTLMGGSFIEMLRNRAVLLQLSQSMTGLVGNVAIPKQTAGSTAYWVGEDEDATEGSPTIGQIGMSPKTIAAYTDISRTLLMQSTPSAESVVRNDLNRALALGIDHAGFYGDGSGDTPRGIITSAGINAVTFAAAGAPTYAEIVEMESAIAADNADVESMAYVMNAQMRGKLKTTQKFTGTNGAPVWEDGDTVNGYSAEVTNQIAAGDMVFGNFADLVVGLWGGLDVTIDPYSRSKSGALRIVMFQSCDFAVRRTESFCLGRAA